jgi:hypothetical protein
MAKSPHAGWYADSKDATRLWFWDGHAWTKKTHSASGERKPTASRRGRTDLTRGLTIGVIVLVVVGVSLAVFLGGRGGHPPVSPSASPSDTAAPTPTPTTFPTDVVMPEGWNLFTSPTGVMSYGVDPTWTDLLEDSSQDLVHSWYADRTDVTSEYSGAWAVSGTVSSTQGDIYVIAVSDGTEQLGLQDAAVSWASNQVATPLATVDEGFSSGHGYEGWRYVYTGFSGDVAYFETVLVLRAGTTMVYAYGMSTEGFDGFASPLQNLADSIVVHHPPAQH